MRLPSAGRDWSLHPRGMRTGGAVCWIVMLSSVSHDASASLVEVLIVTETATADHGLVGDLHTAALISTEGSVD